MTTVTIVTLLFGLLIALVAGVYCFKPEMVVRAISEPARRVPVLLQFALPIAPRDGRLTVRQVRRTGMGLFLLSAWFLLAGILSV
jgi:hypothetical protein